MLLCWLLDGFFYCNNWKWRHIAPDLTDSTPSFSQEQLAGEALCSLQVGQLSVTLIWPNLTSQHCTDSKTENRIPALSLLSALRVDAREAWIVVVLLFRVWQASMQSGGWGPLPVLFHFLWPSLFVVIIASNSVKPFKPCCLHTNAGLQAWNYLDKDARHLRVLVHSLIIPGRFTG